MAGDCAPTTLTFGLDARAIRVGVPTPAVADRLARLLPGLLAGGAASVRASLRLEEGPDGWIVTGDETNRAPFPSLAAALEAVEFLVAVRLLCLAGDQPHLHAAGVVPRDRAVMALGASATGKTTLALTWSAARHPVLCDDVALLGRDGRLTGFRRLFSTTPAGLERAGLPAGVAASDDPQVVRFDPAPHGGWADPAPAAVLAWARYEAGADTAARPLSKPDALNRLTAALLPTGAPVARCFDDLVALVRGADTLELTFGDADHAAARLLDLA